MEFDASTDRIGCAVPKPPRGVELVGYRSLFDDPQYADRRGALMQEYSEYFGTVRMHRIADFVSWSGHPAAPSWWSGNPACVARCTNDWNNFQLLYCTQPNALRGGWVTGAWPSCLPMAHISGAVGQ